jgi:signal transduction histidine kinase
MLDPGARGTPEVVEVAARWQETSPLDLLEVLDDRGTILSSAHWPEQVEKTDDAALRLPEGGAVWSSFGTPEGESLALAARSTVPIGRKTLQVVGGEFLDDDWLESLTGGEATGFAGETDQDGVGFRVRQVPLVGPGGESAGTLTIRVSREPLVRLAHRMRLGLALVGAAVVFGGALVGWWIARRATRPVAETIRAVDAIAAGEADYTFETSAEDGLDALPAAFSRMHRSLEEQQRLRAAAERVAAWREVARRVAHEVKNPLAPIRLTIENLIKARRRAPEAFDEIFDQGSRAILEEVDQLQRLATEFSEFARLPEPALVPTDLEALIDSVLAVHAGESGLTIARRRAGPLPPVPADGGLLSRALRNVVANAAEAMAEGGGTLSVETGVEDGMATIRIGDTGPGLPPEALERLFEPYYTTKPSGTGLGMAIAFRVVTEHRGTIRASNRKGKGAQITIRLPISTENDA